MTRDNAMAEAFNSLFKAECIRNPAAMRPNGGWKSVGDVEIAVAEYVDWSRYAGDLGVSEEAAVDVGGSSAQEACGVRSVPGKGPSRRGRRHGRLGGAPAA
jgi:putative transposase